MRRVLQGLLATGLVLSLVRCSSSGRETFDPDDSDAAALSSSSSSSGEPGPAIGGDGGNGDGGPRNCTEDIDVVVVIDTSSSMDFVLDALQDELDGVVTASNELKAGAHFGVVFFQDNVLLDVSGDEEGGKVHLGAASMASAFAEVKSVYSDNDRNPADGPNGPTRQNPACEENSLDALHVAATQFPWRANAAHVVVVATDDTFLERPDNYGDGDGDGNTTDTFPFREGDYPAATTLVETVTALKDKGIKVFSFSRVANFERNTCSTLRRFPGKASVAYGWSEPYQGADPIPVQTGGKSYDLDQVKDGDVRLGDAINEIVLGARCSDVN